MKEYARMILRLHLQGITRYGIWDDREGNFDPMYALREEYERLVSLGWI